MKRCARVVALVAMLAFAWPAVAHGATGDIAQKTLPEGCFDATTPSASCYHGRGLIGAADTAVSPDGKSVYVTFQNGPTTGGISIFDRSPNGRLVQKAGTAGCISDDGSGGIPGSTDGDCRVGHGLEIAHSVAVSPDGTTVYVAGGSGGVGAVAVFDRAADGSLTQKANTAGCISQDGTGGLCADGAGLMAASSVAVSPDGKSVYVAAGSSHAVAIFDRAANGALTQKAGTAACLTSGGGADPACGLAVGLSSASSVAVSPDGKSVYVTGGNDTMAVFDRASDGTLTQKAGSEACVKDFGVAGAPNLAQCSTVNWIQAPVAVTVSPDGTTVYVASAGRGGTGAITVFTRATSGSIGAVTQKPGGQGCFGNMGGDATHPCTQSSGFGLAGPADVAVTADGKSLLVAAHDSEAVVSLDRAATGVLSDKPGTAGCVAEDPTLGCTDGELLDAPLGVSASPDGRSVYVAGFLGLTVFNRVPEVNAAPTCASVTPVSTGSETPVQIQLSCSDLEENPLTLSASDPPHGSLGTIGSDGKVTYTPDADYVGPDSFTYKANDGTADSTPVTVNITVTNRAPTCQAIGTVSVAFNTPTQVQLACTDPENQTLTLTATDPPHGSLGAIGADGKLTYTPDADYVGPDSFTYKANDGSADSVSATVSLNVRSADPTLSVAKTGTGSGRVTGFNEADPSHTQLIDCGADCEEQVPPGTPMELTPTADPGSVFTGWTGCDSILQSKVCLVHPNADATVTANFEATGGTLWDQKDHPPATTVAATSSQNFQGAYDSFDAQAADDFVVPPHTKWELRLMSVDGSYASIGLPPTTAPSVNVTIWRDDGDTPGAVAYQSASPIQPEPGVGGDFDILLPQAVELTAGTYWLTVQANLPDINTLWYWTPRTVQNGSPSMWRNPADGFTTGCTTFERRGADCGIQPTLPDQMFRLEGTPTALPAHDLTVTKAGSGTGTVTSDPAGIDCGAACSATFDEGASVTLTAAPAGDSGFTGWSGSGCSGTGACTVTLDAARSVTATFDRPPAGGGNPPATGRRAAALKKCKKKKSKKARKKCKKKAKRLPV